MQIYVVIYFISIIMSPIIKVKFLSLLFLLPPSSAPLRYIELPAGRSEQERFPVFGYTNPKILIKLGTSVEEERRIVRELEAQGALLDVIPRYLLNDNSEQGKRRRQKKIRYLLHHKTESNKWLKLSRTGLDANQQGGIWNQNGKVKVVIHGFSPQPFNTAEENIEGSHIFEIGNAYWSLKKNYNVIIVDWTVLSTEPFYKYHEAAASTQYAGQDVGEFLKRLKDLGLIISWEDVHIVGFSLGAHVAGVAGSVIQKLEGSNKVGRITGLDPAGPLFDENGQLPENTTRVLDSSDANFVDIIHCNMGGLLINIGGRFGTTVTCGHADFYPDGGETQRACTYLQDRTSACSHVQCPLYFAQSITQVLISCRCSTWYNYKKRKCPCRNSGVGSLMSLGDKCETSASGKYYRLM